MAVEHMMRMMIRGGGLDTRGGTDLVRQNLEMEGWIRSRIQRGRRKATKKHAQSGTLPAEQNGLNGCGLGAEETKPNVRVIERMFS